MISIQSVYNRYIICIQSVYNMKQVCDIFGSKAVVVHCTLRKRFKDGHDFAWGKMQRVRNVRNVGQLAHLTI